MKIMLILFTLLFAVSALMASNAEQTELTSDTSYYLAPLSCPDLYLDLNKDSIDQYLQLWQPNSSYAQRFYLQKINHNLYSVKKAGHKLELHAVPDDINHKDSLRIGGELNGNTGQWHIIPSAQNNYYYIISAATGRALTAHCTMIKQESVFLEIFNGTDSQKWSFSPVN